jgi:A/G-specific adenine glycosylase
LATEIFTKRLLDWYDQEARVLPWRENPTPYRVWISEMMLQQTRVETVIPYFDRFMEEIPDIEALAKIDEEKLLKLWQGLGYYSRATNLKKAAMAIMEVYGGHLPDDPKILQKLPGIGPYSAGAISSIAFQKVETLMDGNVLRVMARINAITSDIGGRETQTQIKNLLQNLISTLRPGDFNQALMELGATRCLPNGAPLCESCPVRELCVSALENLTAEIPVITNKKPRDIQKQTVLVLCHNGTYGIEKRKATGLLARLWLLPMMEGHVSEETCIEALEEAGFEISAIRRLPEAKHVFTHVEWLMIGYEVEIDSMKGNSPLCWATKEQIEEIYAVPKAHSYYLKFLK